MNECRAIYEQAFGTEEEGFENELFETCSKYLKTLEKDGKVRSMFFLLPAVLEVGEKRTPAFYLYAAATKQQSRGKGYMSELLSSLPENIPVFLKPAKKDLIEFYSRFGFKCLHATKSGTAPVKLLPDKEFVSLSRFEKPKEEDYILMYKYKEGLQFDTISFPFTME